MTKLQELMQCNLFYQDDGNFNYERHVLRLRKLYEEARKEIELYLKDILTIEINEEGCSEASAIIYLPKDDINVKVFGSGSNHAEMFRTPFGYIDAFTYVELIQDDNPIKEFLDFIYKICRQWEPVLAQAAKDARYPLITNEFLWSVRCRDPIGISRLFPLMRGYEDCMKGLYL